MTDSEMAELYQLRNENIRLKADKERLTKELAVAKADRDQALAFKAKRGDELPKRTAEDLKVKW